MRTLWALLICVLPAMAAHYYVAGTGSDSAAGTSSGSPWATIGKVNSGSYSAGDTISFNGGDTFSDATLAPTLVGSSESAVTINSYGTGKATISLTGSGVIHGISLTNPQYVVIDDLILIGGGWTGSGLSATVVNGGHGIFILSSTTTGGLLQGLTITNCDISGFFDAIWIDAGKGTGNNSTVGWNNILISHNTLHHFLDQGMLIQGPNTDIAGPVTTYTNLTIVNNVIYEGPGDPNSGTGGVHGAIKTEAGGINVGNVTGVTITGNLVLNIGGYGGAISGLTYGGSTGIVASNSHNVVILHNEVGHERSALHFDGNAIDIDQDGDNSEVAYNLTYDSVGPSIQLGSFGGSTTTNTRIHHNVSINDARGNNAGGTSEQGAIRLWGSTDGTSIYNNTIYLSAAGAAGTPSVINFEVGSNANVKVVNNVFKVTGGIPFFYGNRTWNSTHISATLTAVGNVYDASSGALLISNDNGSTYTNITSLAAWQALGYETRSGTNYGSTAASYLRNLSIFSPPSNGFIGAGLNVNSVGSFDLGNGSAAKGAGIDPSVLGITLDAADFRGRPSSRSGVFDAGAVTWQQVPGTQISGGASLRNGARAQ